MEKRRFCRLRVVGSVLFLVVLVSCSSTQSESGAIQPQEEFAQTVDSQPTQTSTTIDLQVLENSVSDAQNIVDSINEEIITSFQVQFSDLIREYRYQIRCGSEEWPRWLAPNRSGGMSSLGLQNNSMIEASDLIIAESNDIDVCKTHMSGNDYFYLESRSRIDNIAAWDDFSDPGYKDIFDLHVPTLMDLSTGCKCWRWRDPMFNPTYTAFQTDWANRFVQRTAEFKAKMVDFNSAFKSKVQELEEAEAALELSIETRDAAELIATSTSSSIYVTPRSTVQPKTETNPTQSPDRAVSIRCQDYGNSSTCRVTWSSGRQSWGSPYGPKSGGVVATSDFLDAFGTLICVDLYASGGIKTSYC
jgi:hypothetical protein